MDQSVCDKLANSYRRVHGNLSTKSFSNLFVYRKIRTDIIDKVLESNSISLSSHLLLDGIDPIVSLVENDTHRFAGQHFELPQIRGKKNCSEISNIET